MVVAVIAEAEQNTGCVPADWVHLHHLDTVTPGHTWPPVQRDISIIYLGMRSSFSAEK